MARIDEASQVHALLHQLGDAVSAAELGDPLTGRDHRAAAQPRVGPAPQPGLLVRVVAAQQPDPQGPAAGLVAALVEVRGPRAARDGLADQFELLGAPRRVVLGGVQEGVGEGSDHLGSLGDVGRGPGAGL